MSHFEEHDKTSEPPAEETPRGIGEPCRLLFEGAFEGIVLADVDTGVIGDCNQAFLDLTGWERSELIGRSLASIHPQKDDTPLPGPDGGAHLPEEEGHVIDSLILTKSGAIKEVEVKAHPAAPEGSGMILRFYRDVTAERTLSREKQTGLALLSVLNGEGSVHDLARDLTLFLREWSGCEAVGIRLRQGDDFPYLETRGFPPQFVEDETSLCVSGPDGEPLRDCRGDVILECMCGNILCGRVDPDLPFFTPFGSFWTGSTTDLLAATTEEDRQSHTRNRCNTEGYESVTLVPLRYRGEVLGLLQLNDRSKGKVTREMLSFLEGISEQIAVALLHKRHGDALKQRTAFLEALINASKDGIGVVDEKGRTLLRNRALVEILRIPLDSIDDNDVRKERGYLKGLAKDPERFVESIEYLYAHPDETMLDEVEFTDGAVVERYSSPVLGEDGTHFGRIWMVRDVTERRKAAEAVMRSEERYRLLFDSASDALFVHLIDENGRHGHFIEVNEAACSRLGYSREELLRMSPADINTPEGFKAVTAIHPALMKEKHALREGTHLTKDGREIPVEVHTHLFELQGKLVVLAVARDVTERKNLESQLLQARKMEAIGTLAGGVAHDFNNRLSVILGFGKLVQTGMGENDPLRAYVDDMMRSAEKAAVLTRSLLAFSRKQRIALEAHDVNDVVRAATSLLERLVSEDVAIRLDLASEKLVALVDDALLDQVLMNLASNARDAMPAGGTLTIQTQKAVLGEEFREAHGFGQPGAYVLLSVSDTGVGMDASTMERIFDPFFSTKGLGKGTGLGLASVYGTVKQHKGYVTVSSAPQQGTTFSIYLPLVEGEGPSEGAVREEEPPSLS